MVLVNDFTRLSVAHTQSSDIMKHGLRTVDTYCEKDISKSDRKQRFADHCDIVRMSMKHS